MIAFVQTIYEAAPRGYFHWTPHPEESEIAVTEENPVHVDARERKPAISVILGPTKFNASSLDDLVNVDARDAKEIHTDLLPGTLSLNCMSRVPQECRFLGWNNARTIWALRKLFIKESHIHEIGRGITIGPVSPAGALVQGDTEGEWHNVAVSVPFFLQWTDSVTPLKHDWNGRPIHPLQGIEMLLRTRMGKAMPNLTHTQDAGRRLWGEAAMSTQASEKAASAARLRPPSIRGRAIQQDSPSPLVSVPIEEKHKV
jgi:hypothetical protein